jgi:recombinational DNA repair ATPase RecF
MHLEWLELRDFRNHQLTAVDHIPEGLVVVVGSNGEGKTVLAPFSENVGKRAARP